MAGMVSAFEAGFLPSDMPCGAELLPSAARCEADAVVKARVVESWCMRELQNCGMDSIRVRGRRDIFFHQVV